MLCSYARDNISCVALAECSRLRESRGPNTPWLAPNNRRANHNHTGGKSLPALLLPSDATVLRIPAALSLSLTHTHPHTCHLLASAHKPLSSLFPLCRRCVLLNASSVSSLPHAFVDSRDRAQLQRPQK